MEKINETFPDADMIVMGDFNDEPEDQSLVSSLQVSVGRDDRFYDRSQVFMWNTSYNLFHLPSKLKEARERGDDVQAIEKKLRRERGTYYFSRGKVFNQLDHILISRGLFDRQGLEYIPDSFEIFQHPRHTSEDGFPIPFMVWDSKRREPIYLDGASDHFPVLARFWLNP
jgi:hypothetical protein